MVVKHPELGMEKWITISSEVFGIRHTLLSYLASQS